MSNIPRFTNPPVVQVILGGQFVPDSKLNAAHLGAFWNTLGLDWEANSVQPLPHLEEDFNGTVTPKFRFGFSSQPSFRVTYNRKDKLRTVQVQENRFHVNFMRGEEPYRGFTPAKSEFFEYLKLWREFHEAYKIDPPKFELWEVTYVDKIPNEGIWKDPSDWVKVLPPVKSLQQIKLPSGILVSEPIGVWRFLCPELQCRLIVDLAYQKAEKQHAEHLTLKMTARGLVKHADTPDGSREEFDKGLSLGREIIVRSFYQLTSEMMHERWGLQK
jgi:uncharacterized protein (TIGR04255 family)